MGTAKKGHIEKLLKNADNAIQEGIKKAEEILSDAVEFGTMTAKQASKTSKELQSQAKKEKKLLSKIPLEFISFGLEL